MSLAVMVNEATITSTLWFLYPVFYLLETVPCNGHSFRCTLLPKGGHPNFIDIISKLVYHVFKKSILWSYHAISVWVMRYVIGPLIMCPLLYVFAANMYPGVLNGLMPYGILYPWIRCSVIPCLVTLVRKSKHTYTCVNSNQYEILHFPKWNHH